MATPDTLYYDGRCGVCRRSRRVLSRLDWLGALRWQDLNTTPEADLPVPLAHALEALTLRTARGRLLRGYAAVRRALLRTPLGFLPALLLYLPGVSALGERCYARFARHRHRDEACPLPR